MSLTFLSAIAAVNVLGAVHKLAGVAVWATAYWLWAVIAWTAGSDVTLLKAATVVLVGAIEKLSNLHSWVSGVVKNLAITIVNMF